MPFNDNNLPPAQRYLKRMTAAERMRFAMFRLAMMEKHRLPAEALTAENVVERMLHEFLDAGPMARRQAEQDARFIMEELRAAGWGPVTPEAQAIQMAFDRNTPRWEN